MPPHHANFTSPADARARLDSGGDVHLQPTSGPASSSPVSSMSSSWNGLTSRSDGSTGETTTRQPTMTSKGKESAASSTNNDQAPVRHGDLQENLVMVDGRHEQFERKRLPRSHSHSTATTTRRSDRIRSSTSLDKSVPSSSNRSAGSDLTPQIPVLASEPPAIACPNSGSRSRTGSEARSLVNSRLELERRPSSSEQTLDTDDQRTQSVAAPSSINQPEDVVSPAPNQLHRQGTSTEHSTTTPAAPSRETNASREPSDPGTTATSGPASRDLAPQLRRRVSMPTASASRVRASSLSPTRRARASPGPSSGQLDPDHHWLSEDEGTGFGHGVRPQRRGRQRTSGRRRGTQGGDGFDSDQDGPELAIGKDRATFGSTTHQLHPIHHRPSNLQAEKDVEPAWLSMSEPPLSVMLPLAVPFLTCQACNGLFLDPTTLGCGHSVCLSCSMPVVHRASTDLPYHLVKPIVANATVAHTESQFARNPSMPLPAPAHEMARTPSAGSRVSSFLQRTRSTSSEFQPPPPSCDSNTVSSRDKQAAALSRTPLMRGRPKCPQPDCDGRSSGAPVVDAHVDFVLQKVMESLRSGIPGLDREVERAYSDRAAFEESSFVETVQDEGVDKKPSMGEGLEITRSSSGSSAGESIVDEDESKRAHKIKAWASSKRPRTKQQTPDLLPQDYQHDQIRPEPDSHLVQHLQLDYDAVRPNLLNDIMSELECQICVQLLHNPVTSSCGHTFCQACLARAYDHSDKCPLCRADFPSFVHLQQQKVNETLVNIMRTWWPAQYQERVVQAQLEAADHAFVPLFVCTLSWPGLPTYIHVFEPRYRLMIRRALDSDRVFGMVLPGRVAGEIHEYGTMLYIRNCNMIEDGRSVIECIGAFRFKVLERGSRDGYTTGRIERIDDISSEQERELEHRVLQGNFQTMDAQHMPESDESPSTTLPPGTTNTSRPIEMSTDQLMSICHNFVSTLRSGSAPWVIQRLNNTSELLVRHIGVWYRMSTSGADLLCLPSQSARCQVIRLNSRFGWLKSCPWMSMSKLPFCREQCRVGCNADDCTEPALPPSSITSPRERLRLIVFWIEQFRSSWWFNRGCESERREGAYILH